MIREDITFDQINGNYNKINNLNRWEIIKSGYINEEKKKVALLRCLECGYEIEVSTSTAFKLRCTVECPKCKKDILLKIRGDIIGKYQVIDTYLVNNHMLCTIRCTNCNAIYSNISIKEIYGSAKRSNNICQCTKPKKNKSDPVNPINFIDIKGRDYLEEENIE